jgi:LysM repeat protein
MPVAPAAPVAPETHDYIVARGDTLATIAKKNGVTLKALKEANAGVDPRKLKIGQKLQLPVSDSATALASSTAADTGDTTVYVVKAGDMLGRIAKTHGTTVAKIKALNELKTTSIKVGQKLKLPGAKPVEASAAAVVPIPAPTTYASTSQPAGGTH